MKLHFPGYCLVRSDNTIINTIDNSEMVYVPGGIFIMGSNEFITAKPEHSVYLSSYLIDQYPVTNKQFLEFVNAKGYLKKEYWCAEGWRLCRQEKWENSRYSGYYPWSLPDHPVVGITWYEAMAYCCWAKKKLPTEAQWEKAAKGGIWLDGDSSAKVKNPIPNRCYPWGNHPPEHNNEYFAIFNQEPMYGNKSSGPVNLYKKGASPYSCYSLSGNVWEWCFDWYNRKEYTEKERKNPFGPTSGEQKILRGGSWCRSEKELKITFRTKDFPSNGGWDLSGFRGVIPL